MKKVYTDEFKEMIVELHRSGKPPCETMREYAISSSAYYNCVSQNKTVTVDDQKFTAKEVKSLKRKCARFREEVEILKKDRHFGRTFSRLKNDRAISSAAIISFEKYIILGEI